jgi:hypothetical protein
LRDPAIGEAARGSKFQFLCLFVRNIASRRRVFQIMDREQKRPADALSSLTWVLGGCALAVLVIALFVLSAPRKAPRLNTTPGMTTGEEVLMRDHVAPRRAPI